MWTSSSARHNIFKLAELLFDRLTTGHMEVDVWEGTTEVVEDLPAERKYPFKSGVNIMFGCNNFCSYCIVPLRERAGEKPGAGGTSWRRSGDWPPTGVVEVMLLGQNVNSYGKTP